jgi:hypothetical protein
MMKFISLILLALIFISNEDVVHAEVLNKVIRNDCHLSFSVPKGIEYVEVDGAIVEGDDLCYLAFKYTGSLRDRPIKGVPPMSEDWRAQADFVVTVKEIPMDVRLRQIESPDGGGQSGIFSMVAKSHIGLEGSGFYVFTYSAIKPTESMNRLRQFDEIIFLVGDDSRSALYYLYPSRMDMNEKLKMEIMRSLFLSFRFHEN